MEAILQSFGNVHRSVHADPRDVIQRIITTCEQMLRDRGCARVERSDEGLAACLQSATPALTGRGGADGDFNVYLHGEERVGVKFARAVVEQCDAAGARAIVVSVEGPTPFTRKECEGLGVQFLHARDVCFNVTRHALVPRHERVAEGPAPRESLPRILDTDAVVQYYGWPVGTVVRVWRCFGGHEPIPYFRVVATAGA